MFEEHGPNIPDTSGIRRAVVEKQAEPGSGIRSRPPSLLVVVARRRGRVDPDDQARPWGGGEDMKETRKNTAMRRIVVRKTGSVRLTARCSNYCYGNCCCL